MAEDEDWQKELSKSITRLDRVEDRFGVDLASQRPVVEKYPMLISNYYFNLIQIVDDPIWRQCIPRLEELYDSPIQFPSSPRIKVWWCADRSENRGC